MVRARRPGRPRRGATPRARRTVRFTRDSGVYASQSDGHANRYQLFVERAIALARPGGRLGLVLPAGLVHRSRAARRLRQALFGRCDVDRIVGFDNRRGDLSDSSQRPFVLVTATTGSATRRIACRFGETDPATLEEFRPAAELTMTALHRLSGDALTIPQLRAPGATCRFWSARQRRFRRLRRGTGTRGSAAS